MDIEVRKQQENVTFCMSGRLAGDNCSYFRTMVNENVAPETANLYLDMTGVTYIDSLGLGSLVGSKVTCTRTGTRITLLSPSPDAMRTLLSAKFDLVFSILSEIPA